MPDTNCKRSATWNQAIHHLINDGAFKISDIERGLAESPIDIDISKHTMRRTLKEMENTGWLTRDTPRSGIWKPGEKAALCLNVPAESL